MQCDFIYNELTLMYIENNWVKATDNNISIDTKEFTGKQPYTIWIKLVTTEGITQLHRENYHLQEKIKFI